MTIYVNERNEIHDVGSTTDPNLTPVEVTDGSFDGWSDAKICCYKVNVVDGNVTMMTPYVDSRLIEHIDQLGKQVEAVTPVTMTKTAYIDDTEVVFTNVPQGNVTAYMSVPHSVERDGDRVIVRFEALTEVQTVTINII